MSKTTDVQIKNVAYDRSATKSRLLAGALGKRLETRIKDNYRTDADVLCEATHTSIVKCVTFKPCLDSGLGSLTEVKMSDNFLGLNVNNLLQISPAAPNNQQKPFWRAGTSRHFQNSRARTAQ
jgi:hypothetical protein